MASGRDKNSLGNYSLEQFSLQKHREYLTDSDYSVAKKTFLPGNGLLTGRYSNALLSNNGTDIESFLYGIGANNLVSPPPRLVANIQQLDQLSLFETLPVLVPQSWEPDKGQRLRLFQ